MKAFRRSLSACVLAALWLSQSPGLHAEEPPAEALEHVLDFEARRVAAIQKVTPSVLAIFGQDASGGGSGVVISPDGYALSNFHVTKPCGNAMKCGMADGRLYDAVIVGIDPTGDVALIKLFGRDDFPSAELGDSDQVRVGDWCFAAGNPFLLATDFQPTITWGIVSGIHRYQYPAGSILEYADCIQTDASINPGNSGGPLFNAQGQLIGINGRGSFEKRGRVNVGVGYAISINQIKNFLGYLHSGRIVDHATLGARVAMDDDGNVVVSDILEDCDAYRRGLRYDDVVVHFGGRRIRTVNQFKNVLGIFPNGWRVPLTYRRDGHEQTILVRLQPLHHAGELDRLVNGPDAPQPEQPPEQPNEEPPPGDDPEKTPDQPAPRRLPVPLQRQAPMPETVKAHFEARRGYANYYFNRLHQQRVWDRFVAQGNFAALAGPWTLSGETRNGEPIRFELEDQAGRASLPLSGESRITVTADLSESLDPPGTGGLLAALSLWRRLLVQGIDAFDELYYLGTVPWPGHDDLLDVLVVNHAAVECRFLFHPSSGHLVAIEFFSAVDADPCEIDLGDYRPVDGRHLPHRAEVRWGDRQVGLFTFTEFQLARMTAEKQP